MSIKVIVFDIDNTLFGDEFQFIRPHAIELIKELSARSDLKLALWTGDSAEHLKDARAVLAATTGFDGWTCTLAGFVGDAKDLREVAKLTGAKPAEILLVDDSLEHIEFNRKNGFAVCPVHGYWGAESQKNDSDLLKVKTFVQSS
jgi:FMN phosphatase YigB (HAD superfamily)